jgi:hypothetical protein
MSATAVVSTKKGGRMDEAREVAYAWPGEGSERACAHSQRSSSKPKLSVAACVIALCSGA